MLEQILGILEDVREAIAGWARGVWERIEEAVEEIGELLGLRAEEDLAEAVEEFAGEVDAWRALEEEDLEVLQGEAEELERVREEIEELTKEWGGWEEEWGEEEWADLEQALGELEEAERELGELTEEEWERLRMMEEWGVDEEGLELLFYTLSPHVPGGDWRLRGTFSFPEAVAYAQDLPDWMPGAGYVAIVVIAPGVAEVWVKETGRPRRRR
jgi:hypothetical protein